MYYSHPHITRSKFLHKILWKKDVPIRNTQYFFPALLTQLPGAKHVIFHKDGVENGQTLGRLQIKTGRIDDSAY